MAAGDLDDSGEDEAIGGFQSSGVRARYNDADPWTKLSRKRPTHLVTGDFDGTAGDDLIINRPERILLLLNDTPPFTALRGVGAEDLAVGDLDGDGRDELLADLGANGLRVYGYGEAGGESTRRRLCIWRPAT